VEQHGVTSGLAMFLQRRRICLSLPNKRNLCLRPGEVRRFYLTDDKKGGAYRVTYINIEVWFSTVGIENDMSLYAIMAF